MPLLDGDCTTIEAPRSDRNVAIRVRFAVGDETGKLDIVQSAGGLADGVWHTVRARRDPAKKALSLTVDGGEPTTAPTTTTGHATNGERLCVGAFAGPDIPRRFHGGIDAVAMRLTQ